MHERLEGGDHRSRLRLIARNEPTISGNPISRDSRPEKYTTCTAIAPDAVFTVRTHGDTDPAPPARISAQIRSPRPAKPQLSELRALRAAERVTSHEKVSEKVFAQSQFPIAHGNHSLNSIAWSPRRDVTTAQPEGYSRATTP